MPIEEICCLCGNAAAAADPITREHVPPKQFYPKSLRDGLNLWVVPTHQSCNYKDKAHEEYFYHALYPLVANGNPQMARLIWDDLKRRAQKTADSKSPAKGLEYRAIKEPARTSFAARPHPHERQQ